MRGVGRALPWLLKVVGGWGGGGGEGRKAILQSCSSYSISTMEFNLNPRIFFLMLQDTPIGPYKCS